MTFENYQELAGRTINTGLKWDEKRLHALFGMGSELGEIYSILQHSYQGHAVDDKELKKELGDLLWFIAELATVHGWTLSDIARGNIKKLKKRYPEGFDTERSEKRHMFGED